MSVDFCGEHSQTQGQVMTRLHDREGNGEEQREEEMSEKKLKKMKGGMSEVGCMSHMQAHWLPVTSLSYYSYKA